MAIEIVLILEGADTASDGIEGVAKKLDRLAEAEKNANQSRKSKPKSKEFDADFKEVGEKVGKTKKKIKTFTDRIAELNKLLQNAWDKKDEAEAAIILDKINKAYAQADKAKTTYEGFQTNKDVLEQRKLDAERKTHEAEIKHQEDLVKAQKAEFDKLSRSKNPDDILKSAQMAKDMGFEDLFNELVVKARKRNDRIKQDSIEANAPYPPPPKPPPIPGTPKVPAPKPPPILDEMKGLATNLRKANESLARALANANPEHIANARNRQERSQKAWDEYVSPSPKKTKVTPPPKIPWMKGAATRLREAEEGLNQAQATGNPEFIANAKQQLNNAKRALGTGGFMNNLFNTIGTTRIAFGRLHPLIGRMFTTLMSANEALGPFAPAALAAELALEGLATAMVIAGERVKDSVNFQAVTGGKNFNVASSYSSVANMSTGEFAGVVEKFVDNIASGGVAEGVASRYGIYSAHNVIDRTKQDDMAIFQDAVGKMRNMSRDQANSFARMTGTPQLMNFYDIGQGTYQELIEANRTLSQINQGQRQIFADLNAQGAMSGMYGGKIAENFGTPIGGIAGGAVGAVNQGILKPIAQGTEGLKDSNPDFWEGVGKVGTNYTLEISGINTAARAINVGGKALEGIGWVWDQMKGGWARDHDPNNPGFKGNDKKDDLAQAQVDALNNNTRELKNAREMFGGGSKSIQAMPASVRWNIMSDHDYSESIKYGAVNV